MATRLKPVDAVTIGVGLTGSMAGLELTGAGLTVVGLERGAPRDTVPDFQSPSIHDELRFSIRKAMMQDNVKSQLPFGILPTNGTADSGGGKASFRDRDWVAPSCTGTGRVSALRQRISFTALTTWNVMAKSFSTPVAPI